MCPGYPCHSMIRPLLALLLLAALVSASEAQKATPKAPSHSVVRPNLLLVTIDTLRPDHLHCYGYDQIETPTHRLASRGRHSLRTGLYTNSNHVALAHSHAHRYLSDDERNARFQRE